MKPPEKPEEGAENYETKYKSWNEWDDDNYAARAVIINTMSSSQLLKYSCEKKCGQAVEFDQAEHGSGNRTIEG